MTTIPLRRDVDAGKPAGAPQLELFWRYRERQWFAMALTVVVAGWQLVRGADDWMGATAGQIASACGPVLMLLGIWLWMRADSQRLRLELLRDESARLARGPLADEAGGHE